MTNILTKPQRQTLVGKLFLSDQPLSLWCAESSAILFEILQRAGYEIRALHLEGPKFGGHNVLEVYFPGQKSWGMLDVDYGAFLQDPGTGRILSMQEALERQKAGPGQVKTGFLVHKQALRPPFNPDGYAPHFHMDEGALAHPMALPDAYLDLMQDLGTQLMYKTKRPAPSFPEQAP